MRTCCRHPSGAVRGAAHAWRRWCLLNVDCASGNATARASRGRQLSRYRKIRSLELVCASRPRTPCNTGQSTQAAHSQNHADWISSVQPMPRDSANCACGARFGGFDAAHAGVNRPKPSGRAVHTRSAGVTLAAGAAVNVHVSKQNTQCRSGAAETASGSLCHAHVA